MLETEYCSLRVFIRIEQVDDPTYHASAPITSDSFRVILSCVSKEELFHHTSGAVRSSLKYLAAVILTHQLRAGIISQAWGTCRAQESAVSVETVKQSEVKDGQSIY